VTTLTGQLLSPTDAIHAAQAARAFLLESPRWQAALASAEAQQPLLVQELDRNDGYYYIVPFVTGSYVTARIIVHAVSGTFGEASGIEGDQRSLPPYVDPDAVVHTWYGNPFTVGDLGVSLLRHGTVGRHSVLVWRPCEQSLSLFEPFYVLLVGDRVVYLRVDGYRFDRLTEMSPGS
jgi:hypothetical protein